MKSAHHRPHVFAWPVLANLVAAGAGFALASWIYGLVTEDAYAVMWAREWTQPLGVAAVSFWISIPFAEKHSEGTDAVRKAVEQFLAAVGFILLLQSAIAYYPRWTPIPWLFSLLATALSMALVYAARRLLFPGLHYSDRTLLAGLDPLNAALARRLGARVLGVWPEAGESLANAVGEGQASRVVVCPALAGEISPRALLNLRYSGVALEEALTVYEETFGRVCCEHTKPTDFLFCASLSGARLAMALQAVYNNVFAMALLILALPLIALVSLLLRISGGGGPAIEYVDCAGFQRIPFRRGRFRVRNRGRAGRLVSVLHLENLPQLVNVVRGEMSLFGPASTHREFADHLCSLLPLYSQRFLMKPGILGWAQANLGMRGLQEESTRLEYDLYYVKWSSPSLDLEILLRTLSGKRLPGVPAPQMTAAGAD